MTALRTAVLIALTFASSAAPTISAAQQWPTRPIRFIVPYPAGGSTDVGARIVADHLSRVLGQQIVVENKSGANGNIGTDAAAKAAPDGHTVLVVTDSVTSNPHVYKTTIDPLKELMAVIELSRQPVALAARPQRAVQHRPHGHKLPS